MNCPSEEVLTRVRNRRSDIDGLKALAIIAVVLYHMGIATYGYLGVDVFFVISGFLSMKGLMKRDDEKFSFFKELCTRLTRFYPQILLACSVCLAVGFFTMLPDDLDSLAQSVVATNLSANNILAYITTGNYWEVVNELKPLMHTWYLGVLIQFYIVFFLIYKLIDVSVNKDRQASVFTVVLTVLTTISLGLYCLPVFDNNMKFYLLPFRFFELSAGCLVAVWCDKRSSKKLGRYSFATSLFLVFLLFFPYGTLGTNAPRLLLSVVCTMCLLLLCNNSGKAYNFLFANRVAASIGEASFSIYIWHQIILAFLRYTITTKLSITVSVLYLAVVAGVSALSYFWIEKNLGCYIKKHCKTAIAIIAVLIVFISSVAGTLYLRAGVVRDVPELEINAQDTIRGMHSQYNHRIWDYETVMFEQNGNLNVLIVGDSYARDWANILLESRIGNSINISYAYSWKESLLPFIATADYIFSQDVLYEDIPDYVWTNMTDKNHMYGLGTKRFGENNGIIYSQRFRENYLQLTVSVPDSILRENDKFQASWGDHYINYITLVQNPDGTVPVFTADGKYISQDCWHLTRAGAVMYAGLIDWDSIFSNEI